MFSSFRKFISDERGLETIEYAVMTALIVAALILSVTVLSSAVSDRFTDVEGTIAGIQ